MLSGDFLVQLTHDQKRLISLFGIFFILIYIHIVLFIFGVKLRLSQR